MPDPDLVVRTSGEFRISNFLLWELAYSELVFTDVLWPDFRREHLSDAIREYQRRDRRFGGPSRPEGAMSLYRDRAVVVRTHKLGEADRIVVLLTAEHGKVRAVAKGVRKTKSRFGGRLEPLTHVSLLLYQGRELDIVSQAETIDPTRPLHGRPRPAHPGPRPAGGRRPAHAGPRARPAPLPDAGRARCGRWRPRSAELVVPAFFWKVLAAEGVQPELDRCVRCGRRSPLVAFDLDEGGVLCRTLPSGRCRSRRTLSPCSARSWAASSTPRWPRPRSPAHHEVTVLATRAMEHHLERGLRAVALLERH